MSKEKRTYILDCKDENGKSLGSAQQSTEPKIGEEVPKIIKSAGGIILTERYKIKSLSKDEQRNPPRFVVILEKL